MRKLIFAMHTTLDGFVGAPGGGLDWVTLPDELFAFNEQLTGNADTALYGRKTFEIMEAYWPTAAGKPGASRHDKQHAAWYKKVKKYVASRNSVGKTETGPEFIGSNLVKEVNAIKQQPGANILVFGSPSLVQFLLANDLVDEFYLHINPVLLGKGIPMFGALDERKRLKQIEVHVYKPAGIVNLHYSKV